MKTKEAAVTIVGIVLGLLSLVLGFLVSLATAYGIVWVVGVLIGRV